MFKKFLLSSLFFLLLGCSGLPSITPVDAEVNLGDKTERSYIAASQSNSKIDAQEVDASTETNNFGLTNFQLLLIVFLAGLAMPSFHELINIIKEKPK